MKYLLTCLLTTCLIGGLQTLATAQTASASSTTEDNTIVTEVKVKGVGCSMDIKSIATNVESIDGVTSCTSIKKGAITTFEVRYNPNLVEAAAIHAAIEGTSGCKNPDDRPYKVKL